MRFRLFDRVRRTRAPEPGHGAVADRARGSGRHRLGAVSDRLRHPADTGGGGPIQHGSVADAPGNGAGGVTWRGFPRREIRGRPAQPDSRRGPPWADQAQRNERGALPGRDKPGRDKPGRDGFGRDGGPRWPERNTREAQPERDGPPAWANRELRVGQAAGGARPAWAGRDGPAGSGDPAQPSRPAPPRPGGARPSDVRPSDVRPSDVRPPVARIAGSAVVRQEPMRRDMPVADGPVGGARARVRGELPDGGEPFTSPVRDRTSGGSTRAETRRGSARRAGRDAAARRPWFEAGNAGSNSVARTTPDRARPVHLTRPDSRTRAGLPYAASRGADEPNYADGRRHCGSLERVLHRQWDAAAVPPPQIVRAVDRLAELPTALKDKLAASLDGIFIGPGGVPDLDDMQHLRGVPLPAGRATWDVCAGAYGGRKIVVGAQPSPTPDVMCHEIGHALDDIDTPGKWLSDQPEFRALYDQCFPHLISDFHRQPGGLGRREFFADAFAAIASRQRPALVDMLGGDTRTALNVMLFFNRRYGI
ncbi:MAG: hypothetical protein ACM3ML_19740 [Micromonosporaceae bacterium]